MCRAPVGDGAKRTRTGTDGSELTMLIGAHVSTGGGLVRAIERAEEMTCDSIQIFNQSPRMWRPTRYGPEDFAAFREAQAASRVQVGAGIGALGVVVHPGALKDDTRTNARKRAVRMIREALARTESCRIIYE